MADIDKLIAQFGGSIVPEQKAEPSNELADLAAQFGGTLVSPDVPTTPGGYGAGTFAKDFGKLTAAGAVPGILGAPEAVESGIVQQSKATFAAPSEALNYLSSPDKLANKFVTSLGFKPIFGEETKGLVPEDLLKKQEMLLDEVRAKGKLKTLKDLSAYGQKLGQDIRETASPEIQLAMANFVPTGSLSDIANGRIENLSFGAKPTFLGFAGQFANIFGSVAPGMIGTIVTKDPRYMQAFGFGQAGSEGVNNAREYIQSLDDNQLANNSPYFKELLKSGYDPKTARLMAEEKAVDAAATAQGVVGALGGEFTAKLITGKFDKALLSSVKNRALNIAARFSKGVVIGGTEEGLQEMAEGIASDLAIDKTVVKEIGSDAFANFVLGAIGGGGIGGVKGLLTKDQTVTPKPTPDELFADLTGLPVPPTAPPAAPVAGIPPTIPPASPEVELEPPVPASVLAPVAAMVSTVGLDPATAQRVESLKAELKLIDSRRTDPNNVPNEYELEFFNEREAELAKEITALISPAAPETLGTPVTSVAPIEPPVEQIGEDLVNKLQEFGEPIESRQDAESRFSNGEQIYAFPEQDEQPFLIRNIGEIASYPSDRLLALPAAVAADVITEPEMAEAPAAEVVTQEDQRELERRDAENQIGKPALKQRLESGLNPFIDTKDEAGKKTYFAKGIGSIESKYQVQLDLTPEELRAAKIAEGNIDLAETPEERQAARAELEEVLKPAAERAVSVETPLVVEKEEKKLTKEEQIAISTARMEEQFKAAAEAIGNDQNLLEKELKQAKSVLTNKYQEQFKNSTFDFERKQLTSVDGKLALQWENDGKTNRGSVKVIPIEEVAPKGVTPDAEQTPKTYNFGSGNIDARVSMAMNEAKYKEIYGEDGGILSFSLEGPGVDSSTGFKSVAGITYEGKMTPERLEEMMAGIAANNSKPEKTQAEINKERQAAQKEAAKTKKTEAPKTVVELPEKEKPAVQVTPNKIFTEDAATKARNRLRSKLGQLNSGIDPEFLIDGITLSGYHIEKGARTFAAYAKAMIDDLGDKVKPYLKQWYNAVRDDPSAESLVDSMDDYDTVKNADLPDTTDGMMDLMDPEDKFDIAKLMATTMTGPNPNEYKTILEARAFISKLTGKKIEAGTAEAKEADETIETAVVLAAKDIIDLNRRNGNEFRTYDDLVELYNRQPNLNVRSSTSIEQQAYSTPAPLAYVASRLAGITQNTAVYEPTAGNGMLLIDANPKKVIANELNASRYEMLGRVLDTATITNENAIDQKINKDFDVIIANPPFGVVKTRDGKTISYDVDGLKTNEIDHAIAFKALETMKEDGRAVLIVGGLLANTEEGRVEGYRSKAKRDFYYNLYDKYNVVDHFTVAGDMYKKQGAAYPVDVIVIDGKGKSSRKLPAADLPKIIDSYEQLKEKLNEPSRMVSERDRGTTRTDSSVSGEGGVERQAVDRGVVGQDNRPSTEGERPAESGTRGVSIAEPAVGGRSEPAGRDRGQEQLESKDKPRLSDEQGAVSSESERIRPRSATGNERNRPSEVGGPSSGTSQRVRSELEDRRGKEETTALQVVYEPHSKAASVGTLVPNAMGTAIDQSLSSLEDRVGDIDDFVANRLEMDVNDIPAAFSAEQVDALALAIYNAEQGKGFIIGDQTGIGKGRVVAGMIKYALLQDQIPIFVTEAPNLYADMIRDLVAIGMTDELGLDSNNQRILITNRDEIIPYELGDKEYELKPAVSSAKHVAYMKQLVKDNDLGDYKVIFTTYNQQATNKKQLTERSKMIEHFANNNYLILDESHNAGGSGIETQEETENIANFMRRLVGVSKGSFFSSATYAKRPNLMDLYSSTNMSLAVDDIKDLGEAIKRGGVPMQQMVATMLVQDGQYIRREKTFAGISYDTKETVVNKDTAENMASAMRQILNFSNKKKLAVKDLKKELDEEGAIASETGSASNQITQANFGGTMHNLISQMLLSLKSVDAAKFAIERLKQDEKVILTVANTMGSFIKNFAQENDINVGDPINLSFKDLFLSYLNKQRIITITYPNGQKQKRRLTDEELGPTLVDMEKNIKDFILKSGFEAAPVSPIDYMINELNKAGYPTDEITGRKAIIDYSGNVQVLASRSAGIKERLKAVKNFNNGTINALILNQSGSTGISLHASKDFADQRKRHMIIVQAEADIAVHMQMLGRPNRTGQVIPPAYTQMVADIPAEMRPIASLLKKMASLNANTTAGKKSAVTQEGGVDFMNDYGGQIAQEYLQENPEIYEAIDKRIPLLDDPSEAKEDSIVKFTGFIPIFPIKQQEQIYKELTDRFNELIERENSMGTNKLEAKAVDLDAETLSSTPFTEDKNVGNIDSTFGRPAIMERVDVKRTVKPYSRQEVEEMLKEHLDGKTVNEKVSEFVKSLDERTGEYVKERIEKAKEDGADDVKLDGIRQQINMQQSRISTILRTYKIGMPISLVDPNGTFVYGAISNITNSKKTANPASGSDWKIHIALANGDAKSITLGFSQISTNYKITQEEYKVSWFNPETQEAEPSYVMDIFDKGATVRREKRWLLTGNIPAGYAVHKGQIMTYSKKDGTTGQGVLMARNFDFEEEQKTAPVKLPTEDDAMRLLNEVYGSSVGPKDKVLRITKNNGRYFFSVPKKTGKAYFTDKGLMQALGNEFYKRGSDMIANTYSDENAKAAIKYLMQDRKIVMYAISGEEQARKMFQPKVALEDIEPTKEFLMSDLDQKAESYTLPAGTRLFHGAHLTRAEEIKMAGKMLRAQQKEKTNNGQLTEGNLVWFGDKDLATKHSKSAVDTSKVRFDEEAGLLRKEGDVFSTVTDRPYKLINYGYILNESDAKKLNKALGLPDYKLLSAGDQAWQAAYRGHINGKNVPKYDVPRAGTMSSPWPIIFDALGYDGYYDTSGIAFAAKNAVYLGDEQTPMRIENFVGNVTPTQIEGRRDEVRQENIQRLKNLTREIDKNVKLVEAGKVNLQIQRNLVFLREAKKSMQKVITRTKPSRVGAQWVRTKASADNAAGNLSDDAYKVVENLANKYPNLLDGLQLSVPETKRTGVTGNFEPIDRLVTVYKGGSNQARTMRHEIAHSMEQMMTPEAQITVVESWADALTKAIEKNTDKPSQDYFNAVLNFIEKPSIANQKKANDLMPDYSFYQYLNPSEYWAVNAEPLMKAQLGSDWAKFVKAMQKLLEGIKSVLGFNNTYAVHKEFDRIMSGDQQRITYKMLVEYVTDNAESLKFLNNVEDFDKQFAEDGFNSTPIKPSSTVKDTLLGGYKQGKQAYQNTIDAPAMAYKAMSGKLLRGITYVRNKNIWFGAGLEMAERFTQKAQGLAGKLRDGEGRAMASIAITNALHAGHIASEVIMRGALAFNQKTQMFQAIRRPFSMANVLLEKHNLMDRVGADRAAKMIQMFFEAKRSASIMEEYKGLEEEVARLDAERLAPGLSDEKLNNILNDLLDAKQSLRQIGIAKKKVRFTEQQIEFYGNLEKNHPELRKMLDNWSKVNENMIDMMLFGKIISKKRAERLKGIKDYVPWYRIQDDMADVHDKTSMGGVRSNTNIAKELRFKDTEVDMDIDDIVDNMLHNVMVITRNSMRNYAANRVADAYATRIKGKIAVYPEEGPTKDGAVRLNILRNGRRVIVEIKDPLIAEAVTGMEEIAIPFTDILGMAANGLRRSITLWPEFQVKQLFMDAPTAALVSGVKNPTKLWGETFAAFARAAVSTDPVVDMLKSYGIGGYQSYNRTPEQEYKQQIGLLEKNKYDWLMSKLDKIGDASDYGQRIAIYNRVLAETGDEMQALLQANNVIDFLKRGSGRTAQFLTRTVAFMNAYAQQIDVLAMTLMGSGYTGKDRARALAQLGKTAAVFSFYVMLYSWAVGGHDDYEELDDQTKLRNIYIPKALTKEIGMDKGILLPMHTSASFLFKSIPEMIYNKVTKEGTVNEIDNTRLRHALAEAAMDSLLGPNPVPTGVKPLIEIGLNRSFFTGRAITPKSLEGIDAAEQYLATTSQLGKGLSFITGNPFNESRVLNPIEADHLIRSLFGTTGAAVQWGTNLFSGDRPTPRDRDNPLFGSFIAADIGRAPEDLFYSFKDQVDGRYKTYQSLLKDAKFEQADKYFDRYEKEISAHTYISAMDSSLAEINREIRSLGRANRGMTPNERRAEITEMQRLKNQILDDVILMRKDAGL